MFKGLFKVQYKYGKEVKTVYGVDRHGNNTMLLFFDGGWHWAYGGNWVPFEDETIKVKINIDEPVDDPLISVDEIVMNAIKSSNPIIHHDITTGSLFLVSSNSNRPLTIEEDMLIKNMWYSNKQLLMMMFENNAKGQQLL